jgi:sporadic carbohydrate cluster 2OG-Fe(II) oxygenase/sporadic carbohydrate cluster protein (TIGR04323 family)
MQLDQTRKPFDNQTLDYDLERFPLPDIVLECVRKYYPDVKSLDTLHEVIPANQIAAVSNKCSHDLLKTEFYDHYDTMVTEKVLPQVGCDMLIQKFPNLRFLIPDQDEHGAVLLYHQGRWVGNGLGLRTIWMPFTDCYESNSMQIMDLDISRNVTRRAVAERWSYEQLQDFCVANSWPITLKPGQAHLFFQEHIHGNIPNRTGKTRVSIDIRLLCRDGQPHRKWPGAYFRRLHARDYNRDVKIDESRQNVVTYGEYEGIKTRHLDLHFQTLVVKSYCQKRGYTFPYQHGENEGLNYSHLDFLINRARTDHIILFSIFSLPDDPEHRTRFMKDALEKKCVLHFANEELVLQNPEDLEHIEYLRSFTDDWSSPVRQLRDELGLDTASK